MDEERTSKIEREHKLEGRTRKRDNIVRQLRLTAGEEKHLEDRLFSLIHPLPLLPLCQLEPWHFR